MYYNLLLVVYLCIILEMTQVLDRTIRTTLWTTLQSEISSYQNKVVFDRKKYFTLLQILNRN